MAEAPDRAKPRRHRWITTPAGCLLFLCVALPGYRDCGRNAPMTENPLLIAICLFGLVAVICAFAFAGRRVERWIALACLLLNVLAVGLLVVACLAFDEPHVGLTLGLAAAASLLVANVVWQYEARGRDALRSVQILVPLVVAALSATAALSTWHPRPNQQINIPLGPR